MKLLNIFTRAVCAFAGVCAVASATFAATKPLDFPLGLAVDSKGNLYVANVSANDILIYSPGYEQMASKTITSNINAPTAVAIDPQGNLWVANYGSSNGGANGSVAEYTDGVQNENNSITNGIVGPDAIAIDATGNIFVGSYHNINVYSPGYSFQPSITLLKTLTPASPVFGIAVGQGTFAYGSTGATNFASEIQVLVNNSYCCFSDGALEGVALAIDAQGNVYMADSNGTVDINLTSAVIASFVQLSFEPGGIAIDNARGRVDFSNYLNNSIAVYSTNGTLLKTIQ